MIRFFRVLTSMNLHVHAREIHQTIKWHLLKLLLLIFVLNITIKTSICVFLIAIFSQISQIAFGIIKHLLTGYSDNSKFIAPTVGKQLVSRGTINLLLSSQPVNRCIILGCEALEGGRASRVHEIVCDFKYGFPSTLSITLINKLGSRCEDLLYFTTVLYKRHLRTYVCLRFLYWIAVVFGMRIYIEG